MSAAREEMATSAWELQANKTEINHNLHYMDLSMVCYENRQSSDFLSMILTIPTHSVNDWLHRLTWRFGPDF